MRLAHLNNPYVVANGPWPPEDWREEALCAQSADPDIWFPPQGGDGAQIIRIAKHICGQCPVRQPCLDVALDRNEIHGIWGALTPNERNEIRRHREKAPMTRFQSGTAHCRNGHLPAEGGTTPDGGCRQCRLDSHRRYEVRRGRGPRRSGELK